MKESGFFKRFLKVLGKIYVALSVVVASAIFFFFLSPWLSPSLCGSHNLGNNLYLIDWYNDSQVIVYCTAKRGRTCDSGKNIFEDKITGSNVIIENVESNRKWIIVDAFQDKCKCYFLIDKSFDIKGLDWDKDNCDSIIKSHITHFDNKEDFYSELENLGIKMRFDD